MLVVVSTTRGPPKLSALKWPITVLPKVMKRGLKKNFLKSKNVFYSLYLYLFFLISSRETFHKL